MWKLHTILCVGFDAITSIWGFTILHCFRGFAQTHVHWVSDAIQPSHPLLLSSLPDLYQHKGLFQWVDSWYQAAKLLELQLWYQYFQWIFKVDFLWDGMVWFLCCPSNSQESCAAPPVQEHKFCSSAFFMVQLSHPFMVAGKTIALTYTDLFWQSNVSFLICCLGSSKLFFQGESIFWFHGCSHH